MGADDADCSSERVHTCIGGELSSEAALVSTITVEVLIFDLDTRSLDEGGECGDPKAMVAASLSGVSVERCWHSCINAYHSGNI